MEFSYRINRDDFVQASKLRLQKNGLVSVITKTVVFWIFILICLILLWTIVQKRSSSAPPKHAAQDTAVASSNGEDAQTVSPSRSTHAGNTTIAKALLVNVGPFFLLAAIWFFMLRRTQAGGFVTIGQLG